MEETIFRGDEIIYIVEEAEAIVEYNSVAFYLNGELIPAKDLELVFQNDPNQD